MKIKVGKTYNTENKGKVDIALQLPRDMFGQKAGTFVGVLHNSNGHVFYSEDGGVPGTSSPAFGYEIRPNVRTVTGWGRAHQNYGRDDGVVAILGGTVFDTKEAAMKCFGGCSPLAKITVETEEE